MLRKGLVAVCFVWVILNRALTQETTTASGPLHRRAVCGKPILSSPGRSPRVRRIVGGRASLHGSYPWHVLFYDTATNRSFSGGSIINSRWVVTSASALTPRLPGRTIGYSRHSTKLFVGTTRCNGDGGTTLNIDTEIIHPGYNAATYDNDIALVRVKEDIKFTQTVQSICLESQSFNELEFFRKLASGYVAGCGLFRFDLTVTPRDLREVKLPIQSRQVCKDSLKRTSSLRTESMFCAGFSAAGSGDSCSGDSGGGFVVKYSDHFVLVGVVSWGIGCDKEDQYGFYTDVGRFYNWIHLNCNVTKTTSLTRTTTTSPVPTTATSPTRSSSRKTSPTTTSLTLDFPKSARTRISSVVPSGTTPTNRLRPDVSASVTVDTSTVDGTGSTDSLSLLYIGLGIVSFVLMIVVAVLIRRRLRGKNGATKPDMGTTISIQAQNERRDSDYLNPIPAPDQMGNLQIIRSASSSTPSELAGHYEEIDADRTYVEIIDTIAQKEGGTLDYEIPLPARRQIDGRSTNVQSIRSPNRLSSRSPDELPGHYETIDAENMNASVEYTTLSVTYDDQIPPKKNKKQK